MVLKKQNKDYNCGVYALDFLLRLHNIKYYISALETMLGVTEEDGTSHDQIISFLVDNKIKFDFRYNTKAKDLPLPCLINYQYDNDGHYGVALCRTNKGLILYNPATGGIDLVSDFDKVFYSERYGKGWFLTIDNGKL